jgi:hypothetical protein
MKILIQMIYHHPSIRGKGWQTRREKESINIISHAIRFAYMPNDFPNVTVMTDSHLGSPTTLACIQVVEITMEKAAKVIDYLNSNKNVQARLDIVAQDETMPV